MLVQHLRHALEGGHIVAGLRRVGQGRGGQGVAGVFVRPRLWEDPVGLEIADVQEERAVVLAVDELHRGVGNAYPVIGCRAARFDYPTIAQFTRVQCQMLDTTQRGVVAVTGQEIRQVMLRVCQVDAPIGKPQLAVGVSALAGKQTGPAGGTGGSGVENFAKEHYSNIF